MEKQKLWREPSSGKFIKKITKKSHPNSRDASSCDVFYDLHNLNFQRLANLLYSAAKAYGEIDPLEVETILKVPIPQNPSMNGTTGKPAI